jgi:hypothetical protein
MDDSLSNPVREISLYAAVSFYTSSLWNPGTHSAIFLVATGAGLSPVVQWSELEVEHWYPPRAEFKNV